MSDLNIRDINIYALGSDPFVQIELNSQIQSAKIVIKGENQYHYQIVFNRLSVNYLESTSHSNIIYVPLPTVQLNEEDGKQVNYILELSEITWLSCTDYNNMRIQSQHNAPVQPSFMFFTHTMHLPQEDSSKQQKPNVTITRTPVAEESSPEPPEPESLVETKKLEVLNRSPDLSGTNSPVTMEVHNLHKMKMVERIY